MNVEMATKAISNLRKMMAYRFKYKSFTGTPDLERGGYWIEGLGRKEEWVKNRKAAVRLIDSLE